MGKSSATHRKMDKSYWDTIGRYQTDQFGKGQGRYIARNKKWGIWIGHRYLITIRITTAATTTKITVISVNEEAACSWT